MRTRSIALPLAAAFSLLLASVVAAGGWAQVTVQDPPADPPAGQETTINLDVLQHGMTPVSWPGLTVVATDATSGAVVRAAAQAKGPAGSYIATLVFPSAGDWTLTFESTDLIMEGSVALPVAAPVAAAPAGAGTQAANAFDVLPLAIAVLAVFAALGIGGLVMRSRGSAADSRLSIRT